MRTTAIAGAALLGGIASAALILTSRHLATPDVLLLTTLNTSWALIGTGLLWTRLRPATSYGALLVVVGFLALAGGLVGADNPALHSLGILAESAIVIALAYLVLSFPSGRLGKFEFIGFTVMAATVLLSRLALILFADDVQGFSVFAACRSACPVDPFQLPDNLLPDPLVEGIKTHGRLILGVILVGAIPLGLIVPSSWRRHFRAPALAWAVLLGSIFVGYRVALLAGLPTSRIFQALIAVSLVLPYIFLISLLVNRALRSRPLVSAVTDPGPLANMGQLEATVRRLFRDSGLRLALRQGEADDFVDVRGRPIGPEAAGPQQLWTELDGANRPAAAVIHDAALVDDPEALEATMATAGLVIAHFRLHAELERSTDELRRTQQRTVEAPDSARRRLERELHDTAEQQLLATRLALGRARENAHGRLVRGRLAEVEQLLESVRIELLEIAQGEQPQLLRERGLAAALGQVAKRVPGRVAMTSTRLRRHRYSVESAVYFCCVEALQNALKHGGADVRTQIRLWELDDRLCFEVHDSGVGFEPRDGHGGSGLASMGHRIGAVGGRLDVSSRLGRGTLVSGWVPEHAAP